MWPPLLRFSECPEFVTSSSTHALYAIGWKFKPPVAQPPAAVYGRQVVRDGAITIRAAKRVPRGPGLGRAKVDLFRKAFAPAAERGGKAKPEDNDNQPWRPHARPMPITDAC